MSVWICTSSDSLLDLWQWFSALLLWITIFLLLKYNFILSSRLCWDFFFLQREERGRNCKPYWCTMQWRASLSASWAPTCVLPICTVCISRLQYFGSQVPMLCSAWFAERPHCCIFSPAHAQIIHNTLTRLWCRLCSGPSEATTH